MHVPFTLFDIIRKGISRRSLPYVRAVPQWFKGTAAETEKSICQLAKKGLRPSQIGTF